VLLICDAAPFTVGLVQLSLGNRKRGSSVTDLVFAIVMFKSDENEDCATLDSAACFSKLRIRSLAKLALASPEISDQLRVKADFLLI